MTHWLSKALLVLASITYLCPSAVHAQAVEDRVAFIIGNGGYPKSLALKNPLNDATAIEKQLASLGFETKSYKDLKVAEVSGLRQQMESRLKRDSVLFFYYAGHGVQIDGRNYLLPVDATLNDGDKASRESLYLGDILHAIERMRPKIAVVILDACRDNPFKDQKNSQAAKQGLARVDPPTSTVVFYATRPGGTAQDGDDENGVFTKALLQEIVKPEQPLEVVFRRVSTSVFKSTKSEQEPWIEGVIREEFVINQANLQKPMQPVVVAIAAQTPSKQLDKESTQLPVNKPETPTEALVPPGATTINSPNQTKGESSVSNEDKLAIKSFDRNQALRRLADSTDKKELFSKTSFLCEGDSCFEYSDWIKSLDSNSNLEIIKSTWKKVENSKSPIVCEFDIRNKKCIKEGLNAFILSPLALLGASNVRFEGWNYTNLKITNSGGLQFSANAQLLGLFNVLRPSCGNSDARIEFGTKEIQFNISRVNCSSGVGPITHKYDFEVLLFDKENMELIVKWNTVGFGVGGLASGSGIGQIKL